MEDIIRVRSNSNANSVAGAIAGAIKENGSVETQTIGAGALNQAVKALAIARGFMAPNGVDLICRPAFIDLEVDGKERTAMRLLIEPKDSKSPNSG
ncbi:MAG: stage V sporulation protein S [bacterium]